MRTWRGAVSSLLRRAGVMASETPAGWAAGARDVTETRPHCRDPFRSATARGWGCTDQGLSILHETPTFVECPHLPASSTPPSCSMRWVLPERPSTPLRRRDQRPQHHRVSTDSSSGTRHSDGCEDRAGAGYAGRPQHQAEQEPVRGIPRAVETWKRAKKRPKTSIPLGSSRPTPMRASMTMPIRRMRSYGRWSRPSRVVPSSVNTVKLTTRPPTSR